MGAYSSSDTRASCPERIKELIPRLHSRARLSRRGNPLAGKSEAKLRKRTGQYLELSVARNKAHDLHFVFQRQKPAIRVRSSNIAFISGSNFIAVYRPFPPSNATLETLRNPRAALRPILRRHVRAAVYVHGGFVLLENWQFVRECHPA